jgi:hypothetical protein
MNEYKLIRSAGVLSFECNFFHIAEIFLCEDIHDCIDHDRNLAKKFAGESHMSPANDGRAYIVLVITCS